MANVGGPAVRDPVGETGGETVGETVGGKRGDTWASSR